MTIATVVQTFRPPFLVLTPICVFLGVSTASASGATLNTLQVALILLGCLCAHMSVNALNEYHDFKSGLDLQTQRTPFSGGSGALPSNPEAASIVLASGVICLVITLVIGVYFALTAAMQTLAITAIAAVLVLTYTTILNRLPWFCLVAPGLGFGVLMVVGTHWVLAGEANALVWWVSLIPFLLLNNLLLINQYPDITADRASGRATFPIRYGVEASNRVFAIFSLSAASLVVALVSLQLIPPLAVISLVPIGLTLITYRGALKLGAEIGSQPQLMAANVIAANVTPLCLAVSIAWG